MKRRDALHVDDGGRPADEAIGVDGQAIVGLDPYPEEVPLAHLIRHDGHHPAHRGADEADEPRQPGLVSVLEPRGDKAPERLVNVRQVLAEDDVERRHYSRAPPQGESGGEGRGYPRQRSRADGGPYYLGPRYFPSDRGDVGGVDRAHVLDEVLEVARVRDDPDRVAAGRIHRGYHASIDFREDDLVTRAREKLPYEAAADIARAELDRPLHDGRPTAQLAARPFIFSPLF